MHQKDILLITSHPITYGISPVRSDGNPAVKIEGGGGQQSYLYTVKIANFRQILMSSPWSLIFSLPARTSIIAAANPVGGHYNKSKTVSENLR